MYSHGFLKVASASPKIKTADIMYNANEILNCLKEAEERKVSFIVFPELCLTGASCFDLMNQEYLYQENLKGIEYLLNNNHYNGIYIFGTFIKVNDLLFDCALVCEKNTILGVVPKSFIDRTSSNNEARYFSSIDDYSFDSVSINGESYPFGYLLFINEEHNLNFGVEISNDLIDYNPIHDDLYATGASIVFNLSSKEFYSNSLDYTESQIKALTYKVNGAYVYASNNSFETSSELIYDNHKIISENGCILNSSRSLNTESNIIYADIDVMKLHHLKQKNSWLKNACVKSHLMTEFMFVEYDIEESSEFAFEENIDLLPFVPKTDEECLKIIDAQAISVYKRLCQIGIKKTVIGVSGGLDSTLALLSLAYMCDKFNIERSNIIGITLPSFSNSDLTYNNALELMKKLKIDSREINIKEEVLNQLKAIGHDLKTKDVTYENAQARYRTFTLMNTANLEKAIVIGTSDMSEVALGWSTFNGDQMAMYGINAGIPKTAIKKICAYFKNIYPDLSSLIDSVVSTPISPELKGNQLTEDIIGKYEINDFIMYHFLVNGDSFERIVYLLEKFFNLSDNQALDYVNNFNKRFFSQQFKRLTMPEGIKIFDISLSPRGEVKLVGDICNNPLEKK